MYLRTATAIIVLPTFLFLLPCSDSGEVLTQMSAGDFFGEIGILNLDGGVNRFVLILLV